MGLLGLLAAFAVDCQRPALGVDLDVVVRIHAGQFCADDAGVVLDVVLDPERAGSIRLSGSASSPDRTP
jgi:hypothetical protein